MKTEEINSGSLKRYSKEYGISDWKILKTNGKEDDRKMTLIEGFSSTLDFKVRAILTNSETIFQEGNESDFEDILRSWED